MPHHREHDVEVTETIPHDDYINLSVVCATCREVLISSDDQTVANYYVGMHRWLKAGYGFDAEELDP